MTETFGCKDRHIAGYDRGREHAEARCAEEIESLKAEIERLKALGGFESE